MSNVFQYEDFKSFLKDELERRTLRNTKYSLRAFARDLGVSFSRLSEIFTKGEGISLSTARKIADNMRLSELEKDYFLKLVIAGHSRNRSIRENAIKSIQNYKTRRIFMSLRESYKELLSRWYYIALIEMVSVNRPKALPEIAKALEISEEEVTAALAHLSDKGFIEKSEKGVWQKCTAFLKVESTTPSHMIRGYHKEFLSKASRALENQPIKSRKYLSTVFAVKKERIDEARKELERFNESFLQKYTANQSADGVYAFSLQLFQIDEEETKK
jgi:uncharacterized protein (TIGR02147 family)